jgi:uncharacterized protein (DUF488 family)
MGEESTLIAGMTTSGDPSPVRVFTIGYEGRAVEDVVHGLVVEGVEVLVDVRQRAMSRKRGFGKHGLAAALGAAGIEYVHEPALGNPKENRAPFHAGDPQAKERYDLQVNTVGGDSLRRLIELVSRRVVVLLCYERDPSICHRSVVAAALVDANPVTEVIDL